MKTILRLFFSCCSCVASTAEPEHVSPTEFKPSVRVGRGHAERARQGLPAQGQRDGKAFIRVQSMSMTRPEEVEEPRDLRGGLLSPSPRFGTRCPKTGDERALASAARPKLVTFLERVPRDWQSASSGLFLELSGSRRRARRDVPSACQRDLCRPRGRRDASPAGQRGSGRVGRSGAHGRVLFLAVRRSGQAGKQRVGVPRGLFFAVSGRLALRFFETDRRPQGLGQVLVTTWPVSTASAAGLLWRLLSRQLSSDRRRSQGRSILRFGSLLRRKSAAMIPNIGPTTPESGMRSIEKGR